MKIGKTISAVISADNSDNTERAFDVTARISIGKTDGNTISSGRVSVIDTKENVAEFSAFSSGQKSYTFLNPRAEDESTIKMEIDSFIEESRTLTIECIKQNPVE